jgi:hypothetical protein
LYKSKASSNKKHSAADGHGLLNVEATIKPSWAAKTHLMISFAAFLREKVPPTRRALHALWGLDIGYPSRDVGHAAEDPRKGERVVGTAGDQIHGI